MGIFTKIIAIVYFIVGLYLINFKFNFVPLGISADIESWIMFIGGVIVILAGFSFLLRRAKKTLESF